MTTTIDGTDVSTFAAGVTCTALNGGQLGGRRNIVYNGAMNVAQRSASETGLGAASGYFTVDRWDMKINAASAGRYTMAQVADGPAGFANSLKLTTTTADTSIAAGERLHISQRFEGQDLQHLQKGTATAKQVTVSFYVKGNAAATYTCELFDVDNGRHINQSFAVTTAWNRIELTFAADITDPFDDDNANSLDLNFWLHGGSTYSGGTFSSNAWKDTVNDTRVSDSQTSIFDSTSRTFSITGIQLEAGTVATPFEHRSYGTELALCQRYYHRDTNSRYGSGFMVNTTSLEGIINFPTTMRDNPSALEQSGTAADYSIRNRSAATTCSAVPTHQNAKVNHANVRFTVGSTLTAGDGVMMGTTSTNGFLAWSAEL
tara:strand:+ start:296 stop:1417 length:1122 start_codon:yes stop_codon:yes gene_type:complete